MLTSTNSHSSNHWVNPAQFCSQHFILSSSQTLYSTASHALYKGVRSQTRIQN